IKQFLDRNGLDHIFNHGGDSTEFDRLVRRTPYPPPVTVTSIRRRGWNGRGWRDRMAALLDLQAARVQRRARRLAKDSGSALTAAVRAVVTKAPGATAGRTTGRETAPVLVRARRRRGREPAPRWRVPAGAGTGRRVDSVGRTAGRADHRRAHSLSAQATERGGEDIECRQVREVEAGPMTRILLRAAKGPFEVVSPEASLRH